MKDRHAAVAAFGLDRELVRVAAVLADGDARRRLLDERLVARSAHGAVLQALAILARRRTDATPLEVFVCQQSVPQACAAGAVGATLAAAGLTPRWWAKARAAEVPALARALVLVSGGGA